MVLFVLFHHTRAIVKMSRCNYCNESLNKFHEIANYFVRVILSVYNRLVERVTGNVRERELNIWNIHTDNLRSVITPVSFTANLSKSVVITKTCLYNFDRLKPHFYVVKLEFTGVYIIFSISAQKT